MRVVSLFCLVGAVAFAGEPSFKLVRRSGNEAPETYEIRCVAKKECTVARTRPQEDAVEVTLPRSKATEWLRLFFKMVPAEKVVKKTPEQMEKELAVPFKEHDLMVQWDAQLAEKNSRGHFLRSEVGNIGEDKQKTLLAIAQLEGRINTHVKKTKK